MSEDELLRDRAGRPAPDRPAPGQDVHPQGPVRPFRLGADLSCRANATTPACASASARILAAAWGGRLSAWYPQLQRRAAGAHPLHHRRRAGGSPGARRGGRGGHGGRTPAAAGRTASRAPRARAGVAEAQIGALTSQMVRGLQPRLPRPLRRRRGADGPVRIRRARGGGPGRPVAVRAFRMPEDTPLQFRFKLYRRGDPAPLSDVLPILEDMGLKAIEEYGHSLKPAGRHPGACARVPARGSARRRTSTSPR